MAKTRAYLDAVGEVIAINVELLEQQAGLHRALARQSLNNVDLFCLNDPLTRLQTRPPTKAFSASQQTSRSQLCSAWQPSLPA